MKVLKLLSLYLITSLLGPVSIKAQVIEPDFVGEAFCLKNDGATISLNKEIADYTSGMSFSSNSFNALSIEIRDGKARTRFSASEQLKLVVRAADNNSDPLTIITIYKFKAKSNKRTVVIGEDNSGTVMKSKTSSKDMIRFDGKKFGTSSYLIELNNLKPGEYGIIVSNPNNRDEKKTIVSCFGID